MLPKQIGRFTLAVAQKPKNSNVCVMYEDETANDRYLIEEREDDGEVLYDVKFQQYHGQGILGTDETFECTDDYEEAVSTLISYIETHDE